MATQISRWNAPLPAIATLAGYANGDRMQSFLNFFAGLLMAGQVVGSAAEANLKLDVTSERRKAKTEKSQTESTNSSTEQWGYKVSVQNNGFQPADGLEAVYRVYKWDDSRSGSAEKLIATPGSVPIGSLKPGAKFAFDTENVVLNKTSLKAGWVYTDKSKGKVEDGVAGLWLRIMKDGAVVAEHIKPPTLKTKAKWE